VPDSSLADDREIDTSRVRSRLRDIVRQRKELEAQAISFSDDLAPGLAYIEGHLKLLERPDELYQPASDETRRLLNQAIFKRIYVVNDEVIGANCCLHNGAGSHTGLAQTKGQHAPSQQPRLRTIVASLRNSRPPVSVACWMIFYRPYYPTLRKGLEIAVSLTWCTPRDLNPEPTT
jgi:hypothetical protein